MTQGNVTLNLRNILNGVLKRPPLKLSTSPETSLRDFLHFDQNYARAMMHQFKNRTCHGSTLSSGIDLVSLRN
mgnify:CR=1